VGAALGPADWQAGNNIRLGAGEGDPIRTVITAQGVNLLVFTEAAVYAVDTSDAAVANWTITNITHLAGCVAPETAVAFGQDVLFLSRHGVVALGALSDAISISPAAAISAPVQPFIDRINWSRIERAHATTWRDLYLLALPIDQDEWPSIWLPYNVRTRRWQTPWGSSLGPLPIGDLGGHRVLVDESGRLLVDQTPAAIQESGSPTAGREPMVVLLANGWSAACISRFGGRQETILADSAGRLLRLDPLIAKDDVSPTFAQQIVSWVKIKSFDHGSPNNPKQPFWSELVFQESTASGVRAYFCPDGVVSFPLIPLTQGILIDGGFRTGEGGAFPFVFPLSFRPNKQTRKRWHVRHLPRFRDASLLVYAERGRMRLRSARLSAFVDTPELL
jgi:hypothetical protein